MKYKIRLDAIRLKIQDGMVEYEVHFKRRPHGRLWLFEGLFRVQDSKKRRVMADTQGLTIIVAVARDLLVQTVQRGYLGGI